jgi:glyoxylase-like metal-dependent hydrolase (beta-lactamase superfamily II)
MDTFDDHSFRHGVVFPLPLLLRHARQRLLRPIGTTLAHPLDVGHILGTMREILPGIFTWGSTYADRPWDLNGYAITFDECTVLVDPPGPGEDDWRSFDAMKPIVKIILTNRDHVRDAKLFGTRYRARFVACADEVTQLAPIAIDEAVREGDLIAGALRVIHLPGKSAGEIGLYFDPAYHAVSREMGGILLLGDAIIGNPPGALSLIPEAKLDDPSKLRRSLPKLLDYDFDVLLLCDGQPVLRGGKLKVAEFLKTLA